MSGGEALLNPRFFQFCELMKNEGIKISLLTTGLLVSRFAGQIVSLIDDLVVSLDGDQETHDLIRNTKGAFEKLASGVKTIKAINPEFRITARSVIQKKNFRVWPAIIDSAKRMQLNQISFLPADVSSHAFNRELLWSDQKKNEIMPAEDELSILNEICEQLIVDYYPEFFQGFIAESPGKLKKIPAYYAALYGKEEFPYKQCNAPWVSAVVEPDGTVRPCFFHESIGNIHNDSLEEIINGEKAMQFRKSLNVKTDLVCKKCVCYLNLPPGAKMN
jgi:MoaA/NifB/PqqE/SkfB family radical SAM enzyme